MWQQRCATRDPAPDSCWQHARRRPISTRRLSPVRSSANAVCRSSVSCSRTGRRVETWTTLPATCSTSSPTWQAFRCWVASPTCPVASRRPTSPGPASGWTWSEPRVTCVSDSAERPAYGPDRPYRIAVVCSGNICRSPMGEFLLREALEEAGLGHVVEVDSGGTTSWEVGSPADRRTLAVLRRNGHADSGHVRDLLRLCRTDEQRARVRLFRSFDPGAAAAGDLDMDDPWYGRGDAFEQTYAEVQAAVPGIVAHVRTVVG